MMAMLLKMIHAGGSWRYRLGIFVPADMRCSKLPRKIEEAALTGESVPVERTLPRQLTQRGGYQVTVYRLQNSNIHRRCVVLGLPTNTRMYKVSSYGSCWLMRTIYKHH